MIAYSLNVQCVSVLYVNVSVMCMFRKCVACCVCINQ